MDGMGNICSCFLTAIHRCRCSSTGLTVFTLRSTSRIKWYDSHTQHSWDIIMRCFLGPWFVLKTSIFRFLCSESIWTNHKRSGKRFAYEVVRLFVICLCTVWLVWVFNRLNSLPPKVPKLSKTVTLPVRSSIKRRSNPICLCHWNPRSTSNKTSKRSCKEPARCIIFISLVGRGGSKQRNRLAYLKSRIPSFCESWSFVEFILEFMFK